MKPPTGSWNGCLLMPRIDAALLPVVTDLARGLRALEVPFAVVGALVPELLLEARPTRMTSDADVTVAVATFAEFEALKSRLAAFGFARTRSSHRLTHRSGGVVDLLPFSESVAPAGRLQWPEGPVLNMAGFSHVLPHVIVTAIEGGPMLPLAPVPLYVLLKLVAFDDRHAAKDVASVVHCIQHYLDDDERRYEAEFDGMGVPYDCTGAYLLGVDGRPFLDTPPLITTVTRVLDQCRDPEAAIIGAVLRERGRVAIDDHERHDVFELVRWYRRGTGL